MSDISPSARRDTILGVLRASSGPVPGEEIGARFGVGRTAVCQDVAVLRAHGHPIRSTPRGYVLDEAEPASGVCAVVDVRHGRADLEKELVALVDAGVTVADVVVEHPVYGELRGALQIRGRDEVRAFAERVRSGEIALLSELTGGRHRHTLWAADASRLKRAREKLRALGFLVSSAAGRAEGAKR